MSVEDVIKSYVPATKAGPAEGSKDDKISKGMSKIDNLIQRELKINAVPAPAKEKKSINEFPNHKKNKKRKHKYFLRVGDLGYKDGKPIPYSRKELEKQKS